MALQIGDQNATSGMTKAIYDQMRAVLEDGLSGLEEDKKESIRASWKKTAYAIATGVIEHLKSNMEIHEIRCAGDVNTTVSGSTGPAPPGPHVHTANLTGTQSDVVFTQNNDGTGHVR